MYAVDLIESEEQLNSCKDEWEELLQEARSHEYHHHPDNVLLLLKHLFRDIRPRIFLVRRNGSLCCIAPFFLMRGRFSLKLGSIPLWSRHVHQYKLLGTELVFGRDAEPAPCLRALAKTLSERRGEYELVYLESLARESPLYSLENPLPGFALYPASIRRNVVRGLRTSNSFAEYLATLRKKRRYNLKRNLRKLEQATEGNYHMEKVTDADQVETFLSAVDHVYERCWQRHSYGAYRYLTEGNVAYHRGLARLGWLRSYLLYCRHEPVAYIIGYQYRGRYYYEYIGYDQAWSDLSPGTVLTYLMIEDLHTLDRPELLDFGYGENQYKQIFGNCSHEANNSYLVWRNSPMRIAMKAQLGLSRLYCSISPVLVKTGLDKRIRKRLRQR